MDKIYQLIEEVAKRVGCEPEHVEWYSWPQSFATTAGPGGGAGGNTISSYQVFAFDAIGDGRTERSRYCAGKWRKWNGEFNQKW